MTLPFADAFDADAHLGTVLDQLRGDVDDLVVAVNTLPSQWDAVDLRIEEVRRLARRVEARAAEADDGVRAVGGAVRRLEARIGSLERLARVQDDPPEAVLDARDAATDALLELIRAAEEARSALFDDAARRELEARVESHAAAVRERARLLEVALSASRILARTPPDDPAHLAAVPTFRESLAELDEVQARIRQLAPLALRSAELLGEDERQAAARRHIVAAGEHARADLRALLAERIRAAATGPVLLPPWFTTALGPMPDAGPIAGPIAGPDVDPDIDAARAAWLGIATDVLLYRMRHGVTDPHRALGAGPPVPAQRTGPAGAVPGSVQEYRELTLRLRALGADPAVV